MEPNKEEKDLIRKLINGTATKAELQAIQQLMNTPQGREWFDEVMDETGGTLEADTEAVNDNALNDKLRYFKNKNNIDQSRVITLKPWRNLLKYAAVLILVSGVGAYFIFSNNKTNTQQFTAQTLSPQFLSYSTGRGQRATITLADSSVVTLGPESRLRYPEHFEGNKRDVLLEGEAFFQITKNAAKPFTVHSYELETRVLGTSFKIQAFKRNPLEVSVVTGKVRVSANNKGQRTELATMLPGDHISWFNGQARKNKRNTQQTLAWMHNELIFNSRPLQPILDELERCYDVTINAKGVGKGISEEITVTLNDRLPLNRTMNILAATTGFKYKIEGRTVSVFK